MGEGQVGWDAGKELDAYWDALKELYANVNNIIQHLKLRETTQLTKLTVSHGTPDFIL